MIRCKSSVKAIKRSNSSNSFWGVTFAYRSVMRTVLCPSISLTVSMGTPCSKVTSVAKVCRAVCVVMDEDSPALNEIAFRQDK